MNTELRKRARRALDGPSGWAVSGEAGESGEDGRSGGAAAAPAATGPAQQGE